MSSVEFRSNQSLSFGTHFPVHVSLPLILCIFPLSIMSSVYVSLRTNFTLSLEKMKCELISREIEMNLDGRSFEKLHLEGYKWLSYRKVFKVVSGFASGLARLGHVREERVDIFAETREEWFIALQVASGEM